MNNPKFVRLEDNYFSYYILRLNKENFDYIMSCVSNKNLCILNEKPAYKLGDYLFINNKVKVSHIVKPFETIDDIAKKYNVDREEILKRNNIKNIFVGQQLDI